MLLKSKTAVYRRKICPSVIKTIMACILKSNLYYFCLGLYCFFFFIIILVILFFFCKYYQWTLFYWITECDLIFWFCRYQIKNNFKLHYNIIHSAHVLMFVSFIHSNKNAINLNKSYNILIGSRWIILKSY